MARIAANHTLEQRIARLKQRLVGFAVTDSQNHHLGTVLDVRVDEQEHLNLVILPANSFSPRLLVRTREIEQVDADHRTIALLRSAAEIANSPEYFMSSDSPSDVLGTVYVEQNDQVQPIDATLENEPVTPKAIAEDTDQEATIRLIEEKLSVDLRRKKVGEVIVRKEVETEMIQIPVRRERLVVEQISPERKPLVSIDLTEGEIERLKLAGYVNGSSTAPSSSSISGTFSSPRTVGWLMDAIAHQGKHGCKRIRVEIELDDTTHADLYRQWFEKCADRNR